MKQFVLVLGALLLVVHVGHAQMLPGDNTSETLFSDLLADGVVHTDVTAHVEVIGFRAIKENGASTLYRIESKMLEAISGAPPEVLAFHQWTEEEAEDDVIGSRLIVTLIKNEQDGQYYVPENGSSFPASEELLDLAREFSARKASPR